MPRPHLRQTSSTVSWRPGPQGIVDATWSGGGDQPCWRWYWSAARQHPCSGYSHGKHKIWQRNVSGSHPPPPQRQDPRMRKCRIHRQHDHQGRPQLAWKPQRRTPRYCPQGHPSIRVSRAGALHPRHADQGQNPPSVPIHHAPSSHRVRAHHRPHQQEMAQCSAQVYQGNRIVSWPSDTYPRTTCLRQRP